MSIPQAPTPPPLRSAAAVILSRPDGCVWLGKRGNTRFLPGFWVFPGGASEQGESPEAAALRELREETGLVLEGPLTPFARAITPAYSLVRYDARIFRAELPAGVEVGIDGDELVEGRFFEIDALLALRDSGVLQLAPPTYRQLETFRDASRGVVPWPTPAQASADPPSAHQEVLPLAAGVTAVPLHAPAMPPATWTNAIIVGGKRLFVVDPGGLDPAILASELKRREDEGAIVAGIVLTHHHPDHLLGYLALGYTDVPLFCHPITAPLLPVDFPCTTAWNDGQRIEVEEGLTMVAHFTPGHAPGHLAIEIPERKTLLAADLISSLSSIVIPSSNGDLLHYLDSLARMRALDCSLVIPSHGPPYGQGSDPFGLAIAHRQTREEQVLRLLRSQDGARSTQDLTHQLYRGLDERLMPAAQANIGHHLKKLLVDGLAWEESGGWVSAPGTEPTPPFN